MKHPVLAVFIVIFLFFSLSIALTSFQLKKVTSANFIIQTLNQSGFYNNLPQLVDEAFKGTQNASDNIAFKIVSSAVDPAYLRTQIEKNLPNFIAYLNGKRADPGVELDLRPLKTAVGNQTLSQLEQTISQELSTLPACTGTENSQSSNITNCRPTTLDTNQLSTSLAESLKSNPLLGTSPDFYNLTENIPHPDTYFSNAKKAFKVLNLTFIISLAVSIIFIALLIILGRNPWQRALRWTGFGIMLPGAFHLVVVAIGKASLNPALSACATKANPTVAKFFKPIILVFANNIFNVSMFYAGILFFTGLVMIIVSYIFHTLKKQNVQPT